MHWHGGAKSTQATPELVSHPWLLAYHPTFLGLLQGFGFLWTYVTQGSCRTECVRMLRE